MNTYIAPKINLKREEVFVFTSNLSGFHGAGSAGYASFNESGNVWRKYKYDEWPNGKRGKWNIKGVGWGYQEGEIGKSYAIPSVTSPGARRSLSLEQIRKHIVTFSFFARGMSRLDFYVAQSANPGYNGYSVEEMRKIWLDGIDWGGNVFFDTDFINYGLTNK